MKSSWVCWGVNMEKHLHRNEFIRLENKETLAEMSPLSM